MLLGGRQSEIKQVAVVTRNPKFSKLLCSVLADWKFFAVEDLSRATVIFAERGLKLPDYAGQVVWLTPLPLAEGSFLTVPLSVTRLYHLLEVHFFPTPRRNIRIPMEINIELKVGDNWFEGRLVSLSDRGGRITCDEEISQGRLLQVDMKLAGRMLRLPAEVLYCIPAGDSPGRLLPQVGVIFKPASDQDFELLRCFVEKVCIESACAREGIRMNDPCVSWFDLPGDPWKGHSSR